jgi:hypothetical protein
MPLRTNIRYDGMKEPTAFQHQTPVTIFPCSAPSDKRTFLFSVVKRTLDGLFVEICTQIVKVCVSCHNRAQKRDTQGRSTPLGLAKELGSGEHRVILGDFVKEPIKLLPHDDPF